MTVPGGDSGENSPGGADQTWPEWGPPPSATGFEPPSAPSPGYPPPGVPPAPGSYLPPGAAPGSRPDYPPPGPPTGYPPPGYGAPPGYPLSGYPPPGYPPPGYGPPAGYPPPGYGAPYPGGYAQPSGKTNGLAVTSLVTSIAGIVFAPLSVVGIVLGVIAFNQIKRSGEGGHGLAVAGVAVGAVSLVVGLILMLSLLQ